MYGFTFGNSHDANCLTHSPAPCGCFFTILLVCVLRPSRIAFTISVLNKIGRSFIYVGFLLPFFLLPGGFRCNRLPLIYPGKGLFNCFFFHWPQPPGRQSAGDAQFFVFNLDIHVAGSHNVVAQQAPERISGSLNNRVHLSSFFPGPASRSTGDRRAPPVQSSK